MKITQIGAEQMIKTKGQESIQIDGIPEGFSFKEPDIEVDGVVRMGKYIAYIPLALWGDNTGKTLVRADSEEKLLELYQLAVKENGQK